jgi:hypothetical protein
MLLDDCENFLKKQDLRYAIILSSGVILNSNIEEKILIQIMPIMHNIGFSTPITHMVYNPPLIVFRASKYVYLILITKMEENQLSTLLEEFIQQFGEKLKKEYDSTPLNIAQLIKYSIFELAREMGPEPFGWMFSPGVPELPDEKIWQLGITCMMVLMNQVEGAKKRVLSFHPFVETEEIACIYLFQIPITGVRGNGFDAAIILMGNYEDRAILYENHQQLETILSQTADDCIKAFLLKYQKDPQTSQLDRTIFHKLLKKMHSKYSILPISLKNRSDLKANMQESVRKLTAQLFFD